jgi:26S proteasome regulatory subunit N2
MHAFLQVFYHLGELGDAMSYALEAGDQFNVVEKSQYVSTIIGINACVHVY